VRSVLLEFVTLMLNVFVVEVLVGLLVEVFVGLESVLLIVVVMCVFFCFLKKMGDGCM